MTWRPIVAGGVLALAACRSAARIDGGSPAADAGPGDAGHGDEVPLDAGRDGGPDAGGADGGRERDAGLGGRDAGEDAGDAGDDAGPGGFYGMGIGADALDNQQVADVDVDFRFRAAASSAVESLIWYDIYDPYCTPHASTDAGTCPQDCGKSGAVYACGTGGVMHICLVTDDGSASHLATTTELGCVDDTTPSARPALHEETFPSPPLLTAGQLYHLHWHNSDPSPLVNFTSVDALWVRQATVPRQPTVPDVDLAVFRGTTLRPADTPIFQLGYADGTVQGQGYMEVWIGAPAAISGAAQVREQFTVSGADRTVRTVAVRLNRASGSSALGVRLETGAGTAIEQGSILAGAIPLGDVAAQSPTWATYTFTTPRLLAGGQTYHLVLSAPADTVYQAYGVERGNGYGFVPPTFFGDGDGQFDPDGGVWLGFTQPGGRLDNANADVQFYFGT